MVRGFLLERAWKLIAAAGPAAGEPQDRPPILQRSLPPLPADQRERVQQVARQAEGRLFAPLCRFEFQIGFTFNRTHLATRRSSRRCSR